VYIEAYLVRRIIASQIARVVDRWSSHRALHRLSDEKDENISDGARFISNIVRRHLLEAANQVMQRHVRTSGTLAHASALWDQSLMSAPLTLT